MLVCNARLCKTRAFARMWTSLGGLEERPQILKEGAVYVVQAPFEERFRALNGDLVGCVADTRRVAVRLELGEDWERWLLIGVLVAVGASS